jgi:hypothetical protein
MPALNVSVITSPRSGRGICFSVRRVEPRFSAASAQPLNGLSRLQPAAHWGRENRKISGCAQIGPNLLSANDWPENCAKCQNHYNYCYNFGFSVRSMSSLVTFSTPRATISRKIALPASFGMNQEPQALMFLMYSDALQQKKHCIHPPFQLSNDI